MPFLYITKFIGIRLLFFSRRYTRQRSCHIFSYLIYSHIKSKVRCCLSRLEEERVSGTEARAALRNLVLMISSLCSCGFTELRPTRANTELFQLQGFVLPQPTTPGQAVRNVQAFQVR